MEYHLVSTYFFRNLYVLLSWPQACNFSFQKLVLLKKTTRRDIWDTKGWITALIIMSFVIRLITCKEQFKSTKWLYLSQTNRLNFTMTLALSVTHPLIISIKLISCFRLAASINRSNGERRFSDVCRPWPVNSHVMILVCIWNHYCVYVRPRNICPAVNNYGPVVMCLQKFSDSLIRIFD